MNICFVANLPSFQENFEFFESVANWQSCDVICKITGIIFLRSAFLIKTYLGKNRWPWTS